MDAVVTLTPKTVAAPPAKAEGKSAGGEGTGGSTAAETTTDKDGNCFGNPKSVAKSNSLFYDMNHKKRGKALIFNHENFDESTGMSGNALTRAGTNIDASDLEKVLNTRGFDVTIHKDLPNSEFITHYLEKAAKEKSNEESDCILVAVLTHGEDGLLYASKGKSYPEENLWLPFLADKCRGLAGKPKIFLIQACRGGEQDPGVEMDSPTEEVAKKDKKPTVKVPTHADTLVARATVPGYVSWRNRGTGSYFIQALCDVLRDEAENEDPDDLVSLLVKAQGIVAEKTISDSWKQIPSFTCQLTKKVVLTKKDK